MHPLLVSAEVFRDGALSDPRISHPEGVAVHPDGSVWCGGDRGEIIRISADGSAHELVADSGGFMLGIAFDGPDTLYACDQGDATIKALDLPSRQLRTFSRGSAAFRVPNYLCVDRRFGRLLVSDSRTDESRGVAVWELDLATGEGRPWIAEHMDFANGMALHPSGDLLAVVESFAERVVGYPIRPDGTPGEQVVLADGLDCIPDGLAYDADGRLFIGCYEPSQVLLCEPDGRVSTLIHDRGAELLCHPTNLAFRGSELFTANLGRWHITRLVTSVAGWPVT